MTTSSKYPKWMFIFFPALSMLLGWGLRGHIGGGPFGAMIPGAMLALSICLLLEIPAQIAAIVVVFGVVGIGLGGEMTYGQTLGFLRNTETIWWGTTGTTLKGSVWGLLGAIVFSLGFFINKYPKKTILYGLLIMMGGMLIGFKLINQPMLIYFSDPANPRSESWAALLFGALALLTFLMYSIQKTDFKLVLHFALWGMLGGGLGFGLGGFWIVVGNNLPGDIIFKNWWKMMEFTFGFLLGAALGLAAWLKQKEIKALLDTSANRFKSVKIPVYAELVLAFVVGLIIYLVVPASLEPFVEAAENSDNFFVQVLQSVALIVINYAFYGFLLILVALRWPTAAWQLGITLTFCHTVIDLARDHVTELIEASPEIISLFTIFISSALIATLTGIYQRKRTIKLSMFNILVWSTVAVSTLKIIFYPEKINLAGKSFCEIVCGLFVVDIIFLVAAMAITLFAINSFKKN